MQFAADPQSETPPAGIHIKKQCSKQKNEACYGKDNLKGLPPLPDMPFQNQFTALGTTEEGPVMSGETLVLTEPAQSIPNIMISLTKKERWVIVIADPLLQGM